MADNTIIQQGTFVSNGANHTLVVRSDFDWIRVLDETQAFAQPGGGNATGVDFFWRRGMALGRGAVWGKAGASDALALTQIPALGGFFPIDSSAFSQPVTTNIVTCTAATQPVFTVGATAPLANGAIVRITSANAPNLNGLDFTIDTVTPLGPTFRLANTLANAVVACGVGTVRYVAPDVATYKLFYPSSRVIANITAANPAVVTTLVDHGFTTGQQVRIKVPAVCGMTQMNDLTGTVTNLTAGTFSINIDSTGFTAFAFPAAGLVPLTHAQVVPVGETPTMLNILGDATTNVGYIGVMLAGGLAAVGAAANGPAGVNADVMFWMAGKSFNGI